MNNESTETGQLLEQERNMWGVSYAQTPTYISPTPRAGFSVHLLISNYEVQDISEGLEL